METDGVSAEVLYPTYLLPHFAMDDGKLQAVSFRAYNDWLIEYCRTSPKRLLGIAAISVYDIDEAVKELERAAKAGVKGSIIWQAPHPDLPLHSEHYNKFWQASQALNLPVHLHILTGHGYHKETVFGNKRIGPGGLSRQRQSEARGNHQRLLRFDFLRRLGALPETQVCQRRK